MAQLEIKKLSQKMEEVYQGDPWYGNPVKTDLEKVDPKVVFHKPLAQAHSIAEILAHVISWRELLRCSLQKDTSFSVTQDESFNWKRFDPNPETAWHTLVKQLDENQKQIVALLAQTDDAVLLRHVPNRTYTFRYLIEGIIEHDIYHQAQMVLLAKGAV